MTRRPTLLHRFVGLVEVGIVLKCVIDNPRACQNGQYVIVASEFDHLLPSVNGFIPVEPINEIGLGFITKTE